MWRSITFGALAVGLAACGAPRDQNGDINYYQVSRTAWPSPFGDCTPTDTTGCGGILDHAAIQQAAADGHLVFHYQNGQVARLGGSPPVQMGSQPAPAR